MPDPKTNSRLTGLRDLSPSARLQAVADAANLSVEDQAALAGNALPDALADGMIENVIGTFELPLGVATNTRRKASGSSRNSRA